MGDRAVNDCQQGRFDVVVGTGGLGTGTTLALEGDHTLGREESRAVRMVDVQDRCKLHIILHYVARLAEPALRVVPVGRVGDDAAGRIVLAELAAEGMDVSHVSVDGSRPTLSSICFNYPNGDGGNLTLADSASAAVVAGDVEALSSVFVGHVDRGIVLAAPEVPVAARKALLEAATRHGFLRFASFLSGELAQAHAEGVLGLVDVLSINVDEAAALLGGADAQRAGPAAIVDATAELLVDAHPGLRFCITAGRLGSWVWDGRALHHQAPRLAAARNTAGAGDAHLAGLILGAVAGLDLVAANALATELSALSVTSVHTINTKIDRATMRFALQGDQEAATALGSEVRSR
jgi:ribokinase